MSSTVAFALATCTAGAGWPERQKPFHNQYHQRGNPPFDEWSSLYRVTRWLRTIGTGRELGLSGFLQWGFCTADGAVVQH